MSVTEVERRNSWLATSPSHRFSPIQIAVIYLVFGLSLLYLTDALFATVIPDPSLRADLQPIIGPLEVLVTTGFIFALTYANQASVRSIDRKLESAQRELGILHRVLRHNLRNDITVISGYADHVRSKLDDPELERECEHIQTSCDDILTVTEKAKHIAELHASRHQTTEIDLEATVDHIQTRVRGRYPGVQLTARVPAGVRVNANAQLGTAIYELVENSFEHNDADDVAISITVDEHPIHSEWVEITVRDTGTGIPEAELEVLRQNDETPLNHGSGLGLWMARWIVLQSRGAFEIENTDTGCEITITLPTPGASYTPQFTSQLAKFYE